MALRNIESTERFEFDNAAALRDWLNQFKKIDLHAVTFDHNGDKVFCLCWETEVLSNGSKVNNIRII